MQRLATDTYDFGYIRTSGFTYVDKTSMIYQLVKGDIGKQFFLSRPRRFGKSLLVSTLQRLFEGRRDLFEGLAIDALDYDWRAYPVIRLDMATAQGPMDDVKEGAARIIRNEANRLGLVVDANQNLPGQLDALIRAAAAQGPDNQCVLLIDEYDKPLVEHLGTPEALPYQRFLKSFYTVVKATESLQRFCLMTGVSKFSKVSIFSDLNNLVDITMDARFATLLGYTHDEVREELAELLGCLADTLECTSNEAFSRLTAAYDGYCFDDTMVRVFNPVSLGRAFSTGRIRSWWFETGTPGWLVPFVRRTPMDLEGLEVSEESLGAFEPATPSWPAVLLQTGYLTIKGVEERGRKRIYRLGFPNTEVADGFNTWLAEAYTHGAATRDFSYEDAFHQALEEGDAAAFVEAVRSFFSCIGYDLVSRQTEQAYQCILVSVLRFIGISLAAEVTTSRGRIDMVAQSTDHIFVIELKLTPNARAAEAAAKDAIAQIRNQGYAEPYRALDKRVQLIGIVFDCESRNVAAWLAEDA